MAIKRMLENKVHLLDVSYASMRFIAMFITAVCVLFLMSRFKLYGEDSSFKISQGFLSVGDLSKVNTCKWQCVQVMAGKVQVAGILL